MLYHSKHCSQIVLYSSIGLLVLLFGKSANSFPAEIKEKGKENVRAVPPAPRFQGAFDRNHDRQQIAAQIKSWKDDNPQNIWELSGLHEGDIMIHSTESESSKNGLLDATSRWPGGVIPYYIEENDFDEDEINTIMGALMEYHEKTCLRFRPYKKSDDDYVTIQGKESGCWSLVGRHGRGQVLNLQKPGCVRHGVVVHEFMHALGFYHQQSAPDRDDWVEIHWENIKFGKEHNFKKYDNRTVTDYSIGYDYKSVMHYSSHAFSKNGEPTITPRKEEVKLGQREGLSKKDLLKLQAMYKEECSGRQPGGNSSMTTSSEDLSLISWLLS